MTEYDYSPEAYERHLATQHRIARWVDTTNRHEPLNPFFPTPQMAPRGLPPQRERGREQRDERAHYSARVYPPRDHHYQHQPIDAERERERARSAPARHASTSQSQSQSQHQHYHYPHPHPHHHHPQRSKSQPHPHSQTYTFAAATAPAAAAPPHMHHPHPRRAYTAPASSSPPPPPPHARRAYTSPERPHEPRGNSYILVNAPPPDAAPNPFTGARPPAKPLLRRLLTWSGRVARRGGRAST